MRSRTAGLLPRLTALAAASSSQPRTHLETAAAAAAAALASPPAATPTPTVTATTTLRALSSSSSSPAAATPNPALPKTTTTRLPALALAAAAGAAALVGADAALSPAPARADAQHFLPRLARDLEQRLSGLTPDEVATVRLFEQAAPSVVAVTNLRSFRFFRLSLEDVPVGAGSGFVWDRLGRVVTNYHVVRGATHVAVTLLDGTELRAEVVGVDPDKDIAVVQLMPQQAAAGAGKGGGGDDGGGGAEGAGEGANREGPAPEEGAKREEQQQQGAARRAANKGGGANGGGGGGDGAATTTTPPPPPPPGSLPPLTPVVLGSSSKLLVGQRVYAIGAPLGLDHTFSTGIVSALGRQIPGGGGDRSASDVPPINNVIQTDATGVNPGSSGGPLLDSRGRTIGVLCAIADPSGRGANAGVSFALPIDTVAGVVRQIIEHGRVMRPSLGVAVAPGSFAQRLTTGEIEGVLLMQVPPGSPAAEAGLRGCVPAEPRRGGNAAGGVGDVIVSLNGKPTPDVAELMEALDGCSVGQEVEVGLARYYPPEGRAGAGGAFGAGGGVAPGGVWRRVAAKVKLGERGAAGTVE